MSYRDVFIENYKREYGFELQNRKVLVDDIRVRAVGKSATSDYVINQQIATSNLDYTANTPIPEKVDVNTPWK
jgi:N-methylhydantoinase A/oxoprolinase/acetone carboxylase beta subunit